jgi:hypothetical protein
MKANIKNSEAEVKAMVRPASSPSNDYEIRALAPAEFARWEEFVKQSPQGTLFHTPLWLNAANLPFRLFGCFRKTELRGGLAAGFAAERTANHPHSALTPYLGILFPKPDAKYVTAISTNKAIAGAFAAFLKREFDFVQFRFPPEIFDMQPFIWAGFDAGVRYTYRLSLANLNVVFDNMDHTRRKNIRTAEKSGITICTDAPFAQVMALCEKSFQRQGLVAGFQDAAFGFNAALETAGRCRSFLARIRDGRAVGAVWIVWDDKRAYYLIGGHDEAEGCTNAATLALWRAIEFTARDLKLPEFDFEGSMIPAVERFFRKFGGILTPTYTVSYHKPSLLHRVMRRAVRWGRFGHK